MGIMKKLATVALSAVMLASMSVPLQAATPASGNCGSEATWTLDSAGVLTISGTGKIKSFSSTTTPWYYQRNDITKVVIESGITGIGDYAFSYCKNLYSITIPSTVKTVGGWAFYNCSSIESVKLPSKVKLINGGTFYGCTNLEYVTIPVACKKIASGAFTGCDTLTIKYKGSSTMWKEIDGYKNYDLKDISKKYSLKPLKQVPKIKSAAKARRKRGYKKATVKWGKKSGVTGYQIRYYVKSSGSSYIEKTVKVKSKSTVKKVISLKYGYLDYKVQVRSYKKISGGYNYSKWSSAKTIYY